MTTLGDRHLVGILAFAVITLALILGGLGWLHVMRHLLREKVQHRHVAKGVFVMLLAVAIMLLTIAIIQNFVVAVNSI